MHILAQHVQSSLHPLMRTGLCVQQGLKWSCGIKAQFGSVKKTRLWLDLVLQWRSLLKPVQMLLLNTSPSGLDTENVLHLVIP